MEILEDVLWAEKYRPRSIVDVALPATVKETFANFIQSGYLPNLLLTGSAGIGKTTIAKAAMKDLDAEFMVINGSLNANIDVLRNTITDFASTVTMKGNGRKYVILDEADYLSKQWVQPALRNFIEEFSQNCGFILTCNYPNRIIKELRSRLSTIDFNFANIPAEETSALRKQQVARLLHILKEENVEFDPKVVIEVYKKFYPDLRKCISELQRYSKGSAKIDTGVLAQIEMVSLDRLLELLAKKDFSNVRKWVRDNSDTDFTTLLEELYTQLTAKLPVDKQPYLLLIMNRYDHQAATVSHAEINTAAMLTEIMSACY